MRIALLHLTPRTGDLAHNSELIDGAVRHAAALGATWIVTPELCLSGYLFTNKLGADWIGTHPDEWTSHFCRLAAELGVTLFLGHQERDAEDAQRLYNSVFVIGPNGAILGTHRKVNVVDHCEPWATHGRNPLPVQVGPIAVGVLICADSWTPDVARDLRSRGAQLLISSAEWPPRPHGPEGCWESRSRETGLPLFVCNRSGMDETLNCREAQSVVVIDGQLVAAYDSESSAIVLLDFDPATNKCLAHRAVALPAQASHRTL